MRDFVDADLPLFEEYQTDPRMLAFYGAEQTLPQHARKLFNLFTDWAAETPRLNYQLAVVHMDTGQLIGSGGLRSIDRSAGIAELGLELAPHFWGRHAYAIEIAVSLLKFGFVDLGLARISGTTVSANTKISRLATVLGARPVSKEGSQWMTSRGWREIEWRIDCEQWMRDNDLRRASVRYTHQP